MFRVALTAYLIFATFAGPAFCCCTALRQLHSVGASTASEEDLPCHACCAQHQMDGTPGGQNAEQEPSQERGQPHDSRCPCKEQRAAQVAVLALDGAGSQASQRFLDVVPAWTFAVQTTCVASPCGAADSSEGRQALPFLSSQDLLHALHMLRC